MKNYLKGHIFVPFVANMALLWPDLASLEQTAAGQFKHTPPPSYSSKFYLTFFLYYVGTDLFWFWGCCFF